MGTGQGWGTLWSPLCSEQPVLLLCPWPILSVAALGLRSGDSWVFNQSSGTRDSPATNASKPRERLFSGLVPPKAAPSPGVGRKASPQLLHLLARGPGPRPVAHAHSPAGSPRAPAASARGSSVLLEIIASSLLLLLLLLLQSPPQPSGGSQRFSLRTQSPKALPFTAGARTALPWSPPGAGPVLNVSLAATSPSLWTRAGSGRERRGEAPGPPGMAPGTAGGSRFAPSHHLTSI